MIIIENPQIKNGIVQIPELKDNQVASVQYFNGLYTIFIQQKGK